VSTAAAQCCTTPHPYLLVSHARTDITRRPALASNSLSPSGSFLTRTRTRTHTLMLTHTHTHARARITHVQVRAMYELMRSTGKEIVVGGTSLLSAKDYLSELQALSTPGP
jgi:H2-forming N5,N10-methylenetetrahydromethanopterin dehydrogenase-like enzyme